MSQTTSGRHLARPPGGPPDRRPAWRSIALVALIMALTLTGGFGAYLLVNRSSSGAACGSGRLALQVVADPDQASLLQQAVHDYASTNPVVGDRCVDVNGTRPVATGSRVVGPADQLYAGRHVSAGGRHTRAD